MPTLSESLRAAIEDSGLTMYRVAKDAGLDFTVVSRFCHGQRDIRLETADRLAEYLGLELRPVRKQKRAKKRKR